MSTSIEKNIEYLEYNGLSVTPNDDYGFEIESYTPSNGDMVFDVDELTKEELIKVLSDYDLNREVVRWWPDGVKHDSVPFDNILEHYKDVEAWKRRMLRIAERMPY